MAKVNDLSAFIEISYSFLFYVQFQETIDYVMVLILI